MDSPFDVLRIEPDADPEEIERAYLSRVKEAHPDHGGTAREFQLVRAAYEALTADPGARASNGSGIWAEGTDGASDVDVPDSGIHRRRRGRDLHVESRVEYLNYEVLDDHGWALDDADLFEKAAAAGLDPADRGRLLVEPHESLLEAAENRGFSWPYACRGGACANCAVSVAEGDLAMPVDHILPEEMLDRGFRLSCNGLPTTEELKVVYNVKSLPGLDELRLPPYPFRLANGHRED